MPKTNEEIDGELIEEELERQMYEDFIRHSDECLELNKYLGPFYQDVTEAIANGYGRRMRVRRGVLESRTRLAVEAASAYDRMIAHYDLLMKSFPGTEFLSDNDHRLVGEARKSNPERKNKLVQVLLRTLIGDDF
jgi:hypothetical protein